MTQNYFYIIKDKETDILYAGSKYGKDADPNLFWKEEGYQTSSSNIHTLIEDGGLERFEVVRLKVIENSFEYETKFLQKVDAKRNPYFYNHHNNDGFGAAPNTIVVKNKKGQAFRVNENDERFLSGELVGVAKGRTWKHKSNENYKKPKPNKENYKGSVTIWKDNKWVKIPKEQYDSSVHITPSHSPKSEEHKRKIALANTGPRPKCCCLICRKEMGINNLNQHQNGLNCK